MVDFFKKVKNVIKDFFNSNITLGDFLFYIAFSAFLLWFILFSFYFKPLERYLYVEHNVVLQDYSDFVNCYTDEYLLELEEYKNSREMSDKK